MIWKAKTSAYWISTDQGELQAQVVFIPEKNRAAWRVKDGETVVYKGKADTILDGMGLSCAALLKHKADKQEKHKLDIKLSTVDPEDFIGFPDYGADA